MNRVYIGLDVGSVSLKTVFLDETGGVIEEHYVRHNGLPYQTTLEVLERILSRWQEKSNNEKIIIAGVAVTGSGSLALAEILGGIFVNEIIAQSRAINRLLPNVCTVIEMGGEDSKLLIFEKHPVSGKNVLKDFSMNALCAAGTGSFLDQQATRLGLSIEREFGELALKSKSPPRIAGRCSVFAKSDMIHLQQIATPDYDIVAGLCFALARNFKATIGRGIEFHTPVTFQGGVAANAGMVRAFKEVLELDEDELIIPEHFATMGAIGAVFYLLEEKIETCFKGIEALRESIKKRNLKKWEGLESLENALTQKGCPESSIHPIEKDINGKRIEVFVGIDVGSISTNVAVIDRKGRLLAKQYLMTASRPIEAVRKGLKAVGEEIGDYVKVCGVGTTGSGRYLIGDFVGADIVCNEITAQATASIFIDPGVDTIFEIGGQDSKYISIKNGSIVEFEMNKACAAGTGSFLEEQAERLNINIKEEFGDLALSAKSPVALGDRCTVFMESDLVHYQQSGVDKKDLLGGLAYSIVYNYLNRVVGDKPVGKNIFFQGGTAFNKSVIAAFNKVLNQEVTVPPHHDVTGAIGVALIVRERHKGESQFKGFDISDRKYKITSFECKDCANLCEIRKIDVENEKPLHYGSRCEKYDVDRAQKIKSNLPDLFAERERLLFEKPQTTQTFIKGTVGIPLCLIFIEQLPFWRTFFNELGFDVLFSDKTNKKIIHSGVESVIAETCFPIKIAHGHILNLIEKKPDIIFIPSIINAPTPENKQKDRDIFNCPYVQTIPYTSDSAINFRKCGVKIFSPIIHFQYGKDCIVRELSAHRETLKCTVSEIRNAIEKAIEAQEWFQKKLIERGREILENLPPNQPAIVIIGRPYNACDKGLNLDIPKKLHKLNILPIPMDMLPIDDVPLIPFWKKIYWRYGQRILKVANFLNNHPNLYAIYITNFSCGPDSFILKFFDKAIFDSPFLQIEIDEHSADAGIITRCEAFLDTLNGNGFHPISSKSIYKNTGSILIIGNKNGRGLGGRKVFIPYMCEHAWVFESSLKACDVESEVMLPSDDESLMLGRKYTTGKECYPALLTTGDIIRQIKQRDFNPEKSAFFMPTANGPCRFGCYHLLHRFVLDDLGYKDIPIAILDQDRDFDKAINNVDPIFEKLAWWGIVAVDSLEKLLYQTRPYEVNKGDSDKLFREAINELRKCIQKRSKPYNLLKDCRKKFDEIPVRGKGSRPKIGIVGEIYVRLNPFSNDYLVRKIEELGGEVSIATMGEWVNYITLARSWRNKRLRLYSKYLKDKIRSFYQRYIEKKQNRLAGVELDASPEELFKYAQKYIHPSFQGEAILTIGKTVEYILNNEVTGIINTMPFTCMPGTIVTAILKKIIEDFGEVPCITISYAGQQALNSHIRLEAFLFQAREYHLAHSLSK